MKTTITALLAIIALVIGGTIIFLGLNFNMSLADVYHRYVNTMDRRANSDAKEYLEKILNDPHSYEPAGNNIDSVFYTRQELVDQVHKYTPRAEKESYYEEMVSEHRLKEINVIHLYRAKNGFGALTLGTLKMHYTPSVIESSGLSLDPLMLTNE